MSLQKQHKMQTASYSLERWVTKNGNKYYEQVCGADDYEDREDKTE